MIALSDPVLAVSSFEVQNKPAHSRVRLYNRKVTLRYTGVLYHYITHRLTVLKARWQRGGGGGGGGGGDGGSGAEEGMCCCCRSTVWWGLAKRTCQKSRRPLAGPINTRHLLISRSWQAKIASMTLPLDGSRHGDSEYHVGRPDRTQPGPRTIGST